MFFLSLSLSARSLFAPVHIYDVVFVAATLSSIISATAVVVKDPRQR